MCIALLLFAAPALAVDIAFVDGGVDNLRVARVSTANVTVTADTLTLYDADGAPLTTTNVSLTCLGGGTIGANGPDAAGVLGASVNVYLWAIHNGSTAASLLSRGRTLATITLPSGYTHARLLSPGYTNSLSQLVDWKQFGEWRVDYTATPSLVLTGDGPTFTVTPTFGQTANVSRTGSANDAGARNEFARGDHTHMSPVWQDRGTTLGSAITINVTGTGVPGTASAERSGDTVTINVTGSSSSSSGLRGVTNGVSITRHYSVSNVQVSPQGRMLDAWCETMVLENPSDTSDLLIKYGTHSDQLTGTSVNVSNTGLNGCDVANAADGVLWCYIYGAGSTSTAGFLVSASSSSPTMPAGVTHRTARPIGEFFIQSGTILQANNIGATNVVYYKQGKLKTATAPGAAYVDLDLSRFAPPTAKRALISIFCITNTTAGLQFGFRLNGDTWAADNSEVVAYSGTSTAAISNGSATLAAVPIDPAGITEWYSSPAGGNPPTFLQVFGQGYIIDRR